MVATIHVPVFFASVSKKLFSKNDSIVNPLFIISKTCLQNMNNGLRQTRKNGNIFTDFLSKL